MGYIVICRAGWKLRKRNITSLVTIIIISMARKDYPFNKRVDKKMTNLISGLLTGLVFAPFAIMDSVPNDADIDYTKPVSKTFAVFLIIIGIALIPLFIPIISLAFQGFSFPFIRPLVSFALIFIPLVVWGVIVYLVIMSFTYKEEANTEDVNCRNLKLRKKSKYKKANRCY